MTGLDNYQAVRQLCTTLSGAKKQPMDTTLLAWFGVMHCTPQNGSPDQILQSVKRVLQQMQRNPFFEGLLNNEDQAETLPALDALQKRLAPMLLVNFLTELVPDLVCQPKQLAVWAKRNCRNGMHAARVILDVWETGRRCVQESRTEYYACYQTLTASELLLPEVEFYKVFEQVCTYSMPEMQPSMLDAPRKACEKLAQTGISVEERVGAIASWASLRADQKKSADGKGTFQYQNLVLGHEVSETQVKAAKAASKALAACSMVELLAYLTMRAEENDVPLENGVAYQRFRNALWGKRVVLINPSALLVKQLFLKWQSDPTMWTRVTLVVTSEIALILLSHACRDFGRNSPTAEIQFCSLERWERDCQNNGIEEDGVLFFAQTVTKAEQTDILQTLRQHATQPISLMMLTASADFEGQETEIAAELYQPNMRLDGILLLPKGIPCTTFPRRKLLVSATIGAAPAEQMRLERYRQAVINKKRALLHELFYAPVMLPTSQKLCEKSLRRQYRENMQSRTGKVRRLPQSYDYCPEFSFWYSGSGSGSKKRFCINVYTLGSPEKQRRGGLNRGQAVPDTERFKTIEENAFLPWLEKAYVESELMRRDKQPEGQAAEQTPHSVKHAIRAFFTEKKPVSLKLFALLSDLPEKELDAPAYQTFLSLLHTRMGFLNVETSSAEAFCRIAEDVLEDGAKDPAMVILSQVLESAVREGYSKRNVLRQLVEQTTFKVRDGFSEVRNALVKKAFTMDEMRRLFARLMEELNEEPSLAIGTLIRLFTGLDYGSVCALRWKDFVAVKGYGFSELMVMAKLSADGAARKTLQYAHQYRRIPCVPLLGERLQGHLLYLQDRYPDIPKADWPAQPILQAVSPTQLCAFEKKLLKHVNIPGESLLVPGDHQNDRVLETAAFGGDLLRNNFRVHTIALDTAALTIGEQCYLMGLKQPMTLGRSYLDFLCDGMQYLLYLKLTRFQLRILGEQAALPADQEVVCGAWQQAALQSNQAMRAELNLYMEPGTALSIETGSRFGARVYVETREVRDDDRRSAS